MEKEASYLHRIASLGIEITVGVTKEIQLPPSQIPHTIPETARTRKMRTAGTKCSNPTATVIDPSHIAWSGHGDFGKPPYLECTSPYCSKRWE